MPTALRLAGLTVLTACRFEIAGNRACDDNPCAAGGDRDASCSTWLTPDDTGPYDCLCSQGFFERQGSCERITACEDNPCDAYTPDGRCRVVEAPPPSEPSFACDCPVGFVEGYGEEDWTCVPVDDSDSEETGLDPGRAGHRAYAGGLACP